MQHTSRHVLASLTVLIALQLIMLSALYAGIRPHPPEVTPLFGIAPFIGASISIALAAIIVKPTSNATGRTLSVLAALAALVSFGPQKYGDAQFGLIWPAVIAGQIAALVIFIQVIDRMRKTNAAGQDSGSEF
ncbi:MAG: hypothetical protein KDJ48_13235 [Nitratireductor sp.]|nr:hypothetical protein [Nitratireductor sp.]MCB1460199.1 hypothetical protein [Nitratireductor sp.]